MLIFDSIYDSEVVIGRVIEAGRQYGFVLVAFVPCDSRFAVWELNDTKVGAERYISHAHDRCLIIKPITDSLAEVTEINIAGRTFWACPAGSWVLESGDVVAEAMAVSLDKPLEWATGFFFGNTELNLDPWTVIAGISGFND